MSRTACAGGEDEAPHSSGRGNLVAIIAVVVLAALGYWAFNYIDHQRKMQNCLDSGAVTASTGCGDIPERRAGSKNCGWRGGWPAAARRPVYLRRALRS